MIASPSSSRTLGLGLLLLLSLGSAAPALARRGGAKKPAAAAAGPKISKADLKAAKASVTAGLAAHKAGRYAEAVEAFNKAYELTHQPALLFNLGQDSQLKGDDAGALSYYRQFTEAPAKKKPTKKDQAKLTQAQAQVQMLEAKLAAATPAGDKPTGDLPAVAMVDSAQRSGAPSTDSAQRSGAPSIDKPSTDKPAGDAPKRPTDTPQATPAEDKPPTGSGRPAAERDETPPPVEMATAPEPPRRKPKVADAPPPLTPAEKRRKQVRMGVFYGGLSLLAAGAGTTVAGVLLSQGVQNDAAAVRIWSSDLNSRAQVATTVSLAGYAVLGVGGALTLTGAILWAVEARKRDTDREARSATLLAPVFAPGFAGLSLQGGF